MPSSANVSRGNGPLSGSSSSDISGAEKESPVNPRSLDGVTIETCGEEEDPCADRQIYLYNVMGQEDLFRHDGAQRIENPGRARLILTTTQSTVIEKLEYAINPANEDNPTFNKEWTVPSSVPLKRHELFVPVNPDSLYAYRVTVSIEGCPETKVSGIHYFSTRGEVQADSEADFTFTSDLKITSQRLGERTTGWVCVTQNDTPLKYLCPIKLRIGLVQKAPSNSLSKTVGSSTSHITSTITVS